VLRVTDGDTVLVSCDGMGERVRLLQIDTPERGEPLFEEAGAELEALIGGEPVWLEPWREERDDHGRLLAYLFVEDRNLNLAMIEAGMTPYFDRYGSGRYPREFAAAEREAREARRGIWKARSPR
jgi:micrococcal nuclease